MDTRWGIHRDVPSCGPRLRVARRKSYTATVRWRRATQLVTIPGAGSLMSPEDVGVGEPVAWRERASNRAGARDAPVGERRRTGGSMGLTEA